MKLKWVLFFVFGYVGAYGQTGTDSLQSYIQSLIVKDKVGTINDDELSDLRAYGFGLQNRGVYMAEQLHEPERALAPIDSALNFWVLIRESGYEANLRKFKGILLNNSGKYPEAKKEFWRAVEIFTDLKMDEGVALCYYDLSMSLEKLEQLDSALWYQQQATTFWEGKQNGYMTIVNENQLIYIYYRMKDYATATAIQVATEKEISLNLHWDPVINFYFVSYLLYDQMNEKEKSQSYLTLYKNWQMKLKETGVEAKSIYDQG